MIELGPNRYGKAAIRLVRVGRDTTPHRLRDLTVAIALEVTSRPPMSTATTRWSSRPTR